MAEIMNAQGLDASEFCHAPKPFSKIPRMRLFETTFDRGFGFAGNTYSWRP